MEPVLHCRRGRSGQVARKECQNEIDGAPHREKQTDKEAAGSRRERIFAVPSSLYQRAR